MELINSFMPLLSILFGGGGFVYALLERGKRKAETKKSEADALTGMQDVYKDFVEDYKRKFDALQEDFQNLKKEYHESIQKIKELNRQISEIESRCKKCQIN